MLEAKPFVTDHVETQKMASICFVSFLTYRSTNGPNSSGGKLPYPEFRKMIPPFRLGSPKTCRVDLICFAVDFTCVWIGPEMMSKNFRRSVSFRIAGSIRNGRR